MATLTRMHVHACVQANEGGALIEPWRVNKNSYDQRWDADWFDDDDPRE